MTHKIYVLLNAFRDIQAIHSSHVGAMNHYRKIFKIPTGRSVSIKQINGQIWEIKAHSFQRYTLEEKWIRNATGELYES
jgi:hypothetical protein